MRKLFVVVVALLGAALTTAFTAIPAVAATSNALHLRGDRIIAAHPAEVTHSIPASKATTRPSVDPADYCGWGTYSFGKKYFPTRVGGFSHLFCATNTNPTIFQQYIDWMHLDMQQTDGSWVTVGTSGLVHGPPGHWLDQGVDANCTTTNEYFTFHIETEYGINWTDGGGLTWTPNSNNIRVLCWVQH